MLCPLLEQNSDNLSPTFVEQDHDDTSPTPITIINEIVCQENDQPTDDLSTLIRRSIRKTCPSSYLKDYHYKLALYDLSFPTSSSCPLHHPLHHIFPIINFLLLIVPF